MSESRAPEKAEGGCDMEAGTWRRASLDFAFLTSAVEGVEKYTVY